MTLIVLRIKSIIISSYVTLVNQLVLNRRDRCVRSEVKRIVICLRIPPKEIFVGWV
jgi:hypothetical protein